MHWPTPPHKTILIAVDFSDLGKAILEAGAGLARDLGADVVLVHALPPPKPGPKALRGATGKEVDRAQGEVERTQVIDLSTKWADRLRAAGIDVDTVAEQGPAYEVVLDAARRHKASLIVVGSRQRRGLTRFLEGSVAESVLRESRVPVVVVPPPG